MMNDTRFDEMLSHRIALTDDYCAKYFQFRVDNQPLTANGSARIFDYAERMMRDAEHVGSAGMWSFAKESHDVLVRCCLDRDQAQFDRLMCRIAESSLVVGFMHYFSHEEIVASDGCRKIEALHCVDKLISLTEYFAAVPVLNPQQGYWHVEDPAFLQHLEAGFGSDGVVVAPPAAGGGAFGLATNLGVYTIKDCYGRYTAAKALATCEQHALDRVLEIGAGLGFSAYYALKTGTLPYTLYDLPAVSLMQAHFCMRSLGEEAVFLDGEIDDHRHGVMLRPFWRVEREASTNALWLNQDSLPEIDINFARGYLRHIATTERGCFLSINQESCATDLVGGSQHRVPLLAAAEPRLRRRYRARDFLRLGYVEELYTMGL